MVYLFSIRFLYIKEILIRFLYKKVGVLPIRIVKANVSSVDLCQFYFDKSPTHVKTHNIYIYIYIFNFI